MHFKMVKPNKLLEDLDNRLTPKKDIANSPHPTMADASEEEDIHKKQIDKDFKEQKKGKEDFVKRNHDRTGGQEGVITESVDDYDTHSTIKAYGKTFIVDSKEEIGKPPKAKITLSTRYDEEKYYWANYEDGKCDFIYDGVVKNIKNYIVDVSDEESYHDQFVDVIHDIIDELCFLNSNFKSRSVTDSMRRNRGKVYLDESLFTGKEVCPECGKPKERCICDSHKKEVKESVIDIPKRSRSAVEKPEDKLRNQIKGMDQDEIWMEVYDELSATTDNEGTGKDVDKKMKAKRGERYEHVYPSSIYDYGLVVYAPTIEDFNFAKKVAKRYGCIYKEPKVSVGMSRNSYYKYEMTIIVPEQAA